MAHTCAVTGGRGFVGSQLIKQLLEKGYNVRATVRQVGSPHNQPLLNIATAFPGRLELLEADLLQEGSFDAAFQGCRYLFHVASPFFIDADDPQAQLVDPAVAGTRNVMLAASRNKTTLHRIVLTSSCAAVKGMNNPGVPKNGKTYSEADWNETSTVANGEAYWAGKTQAERTAWELAAQLGLDLVTILPEFIMGPLLIGRLDGTSMGYMKGWVEGTAQSGAPVFCDVRDVARAHILAAELPEAKGRYIVANTHSTPAALISSWLKERFPEFGFDEVKETGGAEEKMDSSKVKQELGLALTPVKETIIDMAVTLIQLGLAQPRKA